MAKIRDSLNSIRPGNPSSSSKRGERDKRTSIIGLRAADAERQGSPINNPLAQPEVRMVSMASDEAEGRIYNSDSVAVYTYVDNNPLKFVDPDGGVKLRPVLNFAAAKELAQGLDVGDLRLPETVEQGLSALQTGVVATLGFAEETLAVEVFPGIEGDLTITPGGDSITVGGTVEGAQVSLEVGTGDKTGDFLFFSIFVGF